jgi:hypothetical protein
MNMKRCNTLWYMLVATSISEEGAVYIFYHMYQTTVILSLSEQTTGV